MRPDRPVHIVAAHVTPFIGKGHPDFVTKGHPDFGQRENPTLEEQMGTTVRGLFEGASLDPATVERAVVSNFAGELFSSQGHLGAMLARVEPALGGLPVHRVEAACASGGVAIATAKFLYRGSN